MARYQGASPFQTTGFVWANGTGSILAPAGVRITLAKPTFSFAFDSIYCEPTLCHRVVGNEDLALDVGQIGEVQDWIATELAEPLIVNGVDAEGKFLANVSETAVVRVIDFPPPSNGTWRFDFAKAAITPGDHWLQAHCVDADGRYIGNVDEGQWAALAPSAPPAQTYGEDFRWNGSAWTDARTAEQKLAAAQALMIALAWRACDYRLENTAAAVVNIGGTDYQFGADSVTRENIIGLNTAIAVGVSIANPRPYFPKGALTPILLTHADFALIGGALLAVKDAYMVAYLTHKAAIMALTDAGTVLSYDLTTGWPA